MTAVRLLQAPSTTVQLDVYRTEDDPSWRAAVLLHGLPRCAAARLPLGLQGVALCVALSTAAVVAAVQEPWQAHQGQCPTLALAPRTGEAPGMASAPGSCVCTPLLPLLERGHPLGDPHACGSEGDGGGRVEEAAPGQHLLTLPVPQGSGSLVEVVAAWVVRPGRWRPDLQVAVRLPPPT